MDKSAFSPSLVIGQWPTFRSSSVLPHRSLAIVLRNLSVMLVYDRFNRTRGIPLKESADPSPTCLHDSRSSVSSWGQLMASSRTNSSSTCGQFFAYRCCSLPSRCIIAHSPGRVNR
uniref:Uncharacterized protein n=1 Tax=Anopheles merus TaxID=30066 RepID=A0A182URQ3_ANOME